jgi:hypothetical protein
MEIVQNRYNVDRVLEKIDSNRIRIMGESLFIRTSQDKNKFNLVDEYNKVKNSKFIIEID